MRAIVEWYRAVVGSPSRLLLAGLAFVALVWWQYPLLRDQDERTDVLVVADGFLTTFERPFTYRVREDGYAVEWAVGADTWCDAPSQVTDAVRQFRPTTVVLSFASNEGCDGALDAVVEAAGGGRVLVVDQPGTALDLGGMESKIDIIDPSPLVGDRLIATSMPCQWWEDCPAGGTIAVRGADGALTEAGTDRVARMVVAELP